MLDAGQCAEEQQMELQALEAIYGDDYVNHGEARGKSETARFSLTLVPFQSQPENNHVKVTVNIGYEPFAGAASAAGAEGGQGEENAGLVVGFLSWCEKTALGVDVSELCSCCSLYLALTWVCPRSHT